MKAVLFAFGLMSVCALGKEQLIGKVYEKEGKNLLFQMERLLEEEGPNTHVRVRFDSPRGERLTEEEVWYENGAFRRYTMKKFQTGEDAEIEVKGNKIHFRFQKGNEKKTDTEDYDPSDVIVVDQIGHLIRSNWEKLSRGETVKVRYAVPERTETVGFKFFKDRDATCDGEKSMVIKMKPSSFVIAAFVDPLYFNFSGVAGHRLCDYTGRTQPLQKKGEKWEPVDARTIYEPPLKSPG